MEKAEVTQPPPTAQITTHGALRCTVRTCAHQPLWQKLTTPHSTVRPMVHSAVMCAPVCVKGTRSPLQDMLWMTWASTMGPSAPRAPSMAPAAGPNKKLASSPHQHAASERLQERHITAQTQATAHTHHVPPSRSSTTQVHIATRAAGCNTGCNTGRGVQHCE